MDSLDLDIPVALNPELLLNPILNEFPDALAQSSYTDNLAIITDFREPEKPNHLLGISLIITDLESLEPFRQLRLQVKEKYGIENQEIKYSKLRASKKRPEYINTFINVADDINGLMCNFIVHPSLDELQPGFYNYLNNDTPFSKYKPKVFRKLELFSHFTSILLSPLITDNTLLHLASDHDNIFANKEITNLTQLFLLNSIETYSTNNNFKLGFIDPDRDTDDKYLKDLNSISDLAIGCLTDLFNSFNSNYDSFRAGKQKFPNSIKEKAVSYSEWIFNSKKPLKRISFFIEFDSDKNMILVYPVKPIVNGENNK